MELSKRKYNKAQVESLLDNVIQEKTAIINEQALKIQELNDQNKQLLVELEGYKNKEKEIAKALENAEVYSNNLKDKANGEYGVALQGVLSFTEKWQTFIEDIKKTNPLYESVNDSVKIKEQIVKILNGGLSNAEKIEFINQIIDSKPKKAENKKTKKDKIKDAEVAFNPQSKINQYIAATTDNGFNYAEVLNPGNLELEDLCKELGLIEQE